MRDFYKTQLVDAVLAGRELTLCRFTEYFDEKPIHRTGIAISTVVGGRGGTVVGGRGGAGNTTYVICRWMDDNPNDGEDCQIDFQEAIELVEEHFP